MGIAAVVQIYGRLALCGDGLTEGPDVGLAEARRGGQGGGLIVCLRRAKLAYRVETREDRLPADEVVRVAVNVRGLRDRIDHEVARLQRG